MFGHRSAVEQHKPSSIAWPRCGGLAERKQSFVREVVNDDDLVLGDALRVEVFAHAFVYGDDPIRKRVTRLFLDTQELDQKTVGAMIPAHIELGHRVVDVENDLAAAESWNERGQNKNIGHVVDVDDVELAAK